MLQSRGSGPHGLPNEFLGRTGLWRTQWGQLDGLGTIAPSRGSTNVPGRAGLNRPRFPVPSRIHSYFCPFCTAPFLGVDGRRDQARGTSGSRGCLDGSYLVDSASSHMLVSKIKPCMSKYKQSYCETANGSLNQLSFI
jgi:hypothetical protein